MMRTMFHHPHGVRGGTNEQEVEARLMSVLGHVSERVTTLHVTMEDANGPKGGPDKTCKLELHGPWDTVVVSATHEHMMGAVDAAAHKAATAVDRVMKKITAHR